jgi:hypothetical protein
MTIKIPKNQIEELLWQEEPNAIWHTNIQPTCDFCGKKSDIVREFKISGDDDDGFRACWLWKAKPTCAWEVEQMLFFQNPDIEFVYTRIIEYKPIGAKKKKKAKRREPLGLSKRYFVLKRDGFQCVLCGASGKDAQLEIDHILPVSAGGKDNLENLRTLCFKCNRGKRDTIE